MDNVIYRCVIQLIAMQAGRGLYRSGKASAVLRALRGVPRGAARGVRRRR